MDKIKILILAANPWDTDRLRLDEEFREITELWGKNQQNENKFEIRLALATRRDDLLDKLQAFEPNIVHFSGHGEKDGLLFANEVADTDKKGDTDKISQEVLVELFSMCKEHLHCVLLNACNSEGIAHAIAENIDYAIGMSEKIDDIAAVKFTKGFYRALFNGKEIKEAYQFALLELKLAKFTSQQDIPVLFDKQSLSQPNPPQIQKPFVPNVHYDVLIHAAATEKDWALHFQDELQKHLTKAMQNQVGYLQVQADQQINLEQAAVNLFVVSKDYIDQYQTLLSQLVKPNKKQFVIARSEACPDELTGLSKYRFYTDQIDFSNSAELEELASVLAKQLQELKKQHEFTQISNPFSEPLVFIHTEPNAEQVDSAKNLKPLFKDKGMACAFANPKVYKEDVKLNQKNCNGVLIVYGNDYLWARQRIDEYYRLKQRRKEPLKIVAIHADCSKEIKDTEGLDIYDSVPVVPCPPQNTEALIAKFAEALKEHGK